VSAGEGGRSPWHEELAEHGFLHMRGASPLDLVEVLEALGRSIHVEEVRETPGSASLVKSRSSIPWHTDHHRAERIVWFCLAQAETGGETLLTDGHAALELLDPAHVRTLRSIMLFEHSVFRGDAPQYPMLTDGARGLPRLYFSLWLADEQMEGAQREAFDAFGQALDRVEHHRFLLQPGDILAIDNTRMVHARTAIGGERVRHLRRYWLSAT
jgi:alpha-ketoglutarate-dependent taurine dioxygenase